MAAKLADTPGEIILNNRIEIRYCTQCRWLLRAAWMAQELLTTFDQEIAE
jgi:selenoprotein W-related protein